MKLLLDTHTFIFWDSQPSKLSQRALELLTNKDNLRLLSVVSLWEIQIKQQLGKLTLNKTLEDIIASPKFPPPPHARDTTTADSTHLHKPV
jgi:PIN domain nuclease of toxin-antitoxin system